MVLARQALFGDVGKDGAHDAAQCLLRQKIVSDQGIGHDWQSVIGN
jgi:hypothetical protein